MLRHLLSPDSKHRSYRGRFRVGGEARIREVTLHTTIKEVAEKRLKEMHEDVERETEGLIPASSTRHALKRPLGELFKEFMEEIERRGRSLAYQRITKLRFELMAKECRWHCMKDVTARSFLDWRNAQTKYEPRTLNNFFEAARVFCNWVDRTYEIENPLKRVENLPVPVKQPYGPRAFTGEELGRLFAAARPKWRLLYRVLAFTGLRINEARRLCWGDLRLDDKRPGIFLRPENTKAKRCDWLPIISVLVPELRAHSCRLDKKDTPVFRTGIASIETLRKDMDKAGIPRVDEFGRDAGFHTFRRTFITLLQEGGVHPRTIMQLARHKSPRLTDWTYTDTTKLPLAEGLEKLAVLHKSPLPHPHAPQPAPLKNGQNGHFEAKHGNTSPSYDLPSLSQVADFEQTWDAFSTPVQVCPKTAEVAGVGVEPTHL